MLTSGSRARQVIAASMIASMFFRASARLCSPRARTGVGVIVAPIYLNILVQVTWYACVAKVSRRVLTPVSPADR
jgi:hypothetical protein